MIVNEESLLLSFGGGLGSCVSHVGVSEWMTSLLSSCDLVVGSERFLFTVALVFIFFSCNLFEAIMEK